MAKAITGTKLLAAIAVAMASAPGYLFITQAQAASVDAADINVNTAIVDGDKAAAVLTDAGKAKVEAAKTAAPEPKPEFVIEAIAVVPNKRGRSGGGQTKYPFDKLEVGQSFFIAKSEKQPEPAKAMASTVSSANARYAEPQVNADGTALMETVTIKGKEVTRQVKKLTRKFAVQAVEGGCRVGRIQ